MDDITGIERGNTFSDSVILAAKGVRKPRILFCIKENNSYYGDFHGYTAETKTYMYHVDGAIQLLGFRESFTLQDYVEVVVDEILL